MLHCNTKHGIDDARRGVLVSQKNKSGAIFVHHARLEEAMGEREKALVRLEDVSKSFGAIQALSHVSLDIGVGEVVGLMGDNGAGKSTLVKILAGNYKPSSGTYLIEGE